MTPAFIAQLGTISNLLNGIAYAFVVAAPAIFVFGVTLLGTAIEQSQSEEKAARENSKIDLDKEITEVEEVLKKVRANGDTTELSSKLVDLKNRRSGADEEILKIRKKYQSINLKHTVLVPCVVLLLLVLINPLSTFPNVWIAILAVASQIGLLCYATYRLYRSLEIIQLVSLGKKEIDPFPRLKEAIKQALTEHQDINKTEAQMTFIEKSFPLNAAVSTPLDIKFRVKITKGTALKDAQVWFYVADGIELISPNESSSWRQAADFSLPNVRTVRINMGTVSTGTANPATLKIKTPATPGKYLIRTFLLAEGYSGERKDLIILVG